MRKNKLTGAIPGAGRKKENRETRILNVSISPEAKAVLDKLPRMELQIGGFKWAGYWDKMHRFTKQEVKGWLEIACTEKDIDNGNIKDMIKFQVTR